MKISFASLRGQEASNSPGTLALYLERTLLSLLTDPDTQALLYGKNRALGNVFGLITLVRKRAENLVDGSPPLVDVDNPNAVSVALFEIQQGKVTRRTPGSQPDIDPNLGESTSDSQAAALASALGLDL